MSDPTNLTQKFTALKDLISANHTALMTEIAAIKTALTSASGNIDAAPIVAAIQALAGPYPGKTLTDLYGVTTTIKNNVGLATGDETTTLIGLLAQIRFALTQPGLTNDTIYEMIQNIDLTLNRPGTIDNTILGELEAIRTGQLLIVANTTDPTLIAPVGICETPLVSSGKNYVMAGFSLAGLSFGIASTLASWTPNDVNTWPPNIPTNLYMADDPALGNYGIAAMDWAAWKIYVASSAPYFGILIGSSQRFNTNEWMILSGTSTFRFFVEGTASLKVYICGGDAPAVETLSSQNVPLTSSGGGSYAYQMIVWPEAYAADMMSWDGNWYPTENVMATTNVMAQRVTLISGSTCFVSSSTGGGTNTLATLTSTNPTYDIVSSLPTGGRLFVFADGSAFTITIGPIA